MNLFENELSGILLDNIEHKAIQYLEACDEEYQILLTQRNSIIDNYHNVLNFLEYNKPIQLSKEEHGVMIHYLEIEKEMNDMIKFMIYLYGHANCSSYLQMMNILQERTIEGNNEEDKIL